MSRHHMGTKDVGWGQPGDHYYGGTCRRCGKSGRSFPGDCANSAEAWLQHLMDTDEAPGGSTIESGHLYTLFMLMRREKQDADARIKSLTETVNGMADALAEVRQRLGLSPGSSGRGDGGEYPGTPA
jgi:hypothetical protein